jgi:hypothetical protein
MFGPFQYRRSRREVEGRDDHVRFSLRDTIMVDLLGGKPGKWDCEANVRLCEHERTRIEAACRKARAREPEGTDIGLQKGDFFQITGSSPGDVRLVLTFPDSKTASSLVDGCTRSVILKGLFRRTP